ncbi:hypothetical protein ACB092_05G192300 [Castanea dentata]
MSIIFLALLACYLLSFNIEATPNFEAEALLRLRWKQSLGNQTSLQSWTPGKINEKLTTGPCMWFGIACNMAGSVTEISLPSARCNLLTGPIPSQIGTLSRLTHLNLSMNFHSGNLPLSLTNLTNLSLLCMGHNLISGELDPRLFSNWTRLEFLELQNNNFSGVIPPQIGLLTNLKQLALMNNHIFGSIPPDIGNLINLVALALSGNHLMGPIPPSLGNLSKVTVVYLHQNRLSGPLPQTIQNAKNLKDLRVFKNQLSGPVPQGLANLSSLEKLELCGNYFSGHLPPVCPIPKSLRNCKSLKRLRHHKNQLTGMLDQGFGVYPNLYYLDLSYNNLKGVLSPQWGGCRKLESLRIAGNKITGEIPSELGELNQLGLLDLSSNQIVGEIPKQLGRLSKLIILHLSDNQISGQLPSEIGGLSNLEDLDFSANRLSGQIPEQVGDCSRLRNLCLSKNYFNGTIPHTIGDPAHQGLLDLSQNRLTGDIPPQPESLSQRLTSIDLSYNELEGPLPDNNIFRHANPTAFSNNKDLCGIVEGLRPCNVTSLENGAHSIAGRKVFIIVGACLFGMLLSFAILVWFLTLFGRAELKSKSKEATTSNSGNIFSVLNFDGKIVYEDIITATNDFDDMYCIGMGGTARVYKAQMPTGHVLAIKKVWCLEGEEEEEMVETFKNEIRVLSDIRHRNIVKFYGFCSHRQHKFLIYDYIERGSLANLCWSKRVDIVRDIANALSYMHHDCTPPIIHRDISSKNVLLNSEFEACISDFGTARFLKPESSNWTAMAGTYGYVAPEIAYTMRVTQKSDDFSFGVLALEVIMGKHPAELISSLSTLEQSIELKELLDLRLPPPTVLFEKDVASVVKQALSCLHLTPNCRPTMRGVSQALLKA